MKFFYIYSLLTLIILRVACVGAELPKFSASVTISVSANELIEQEVTSYISRELRQLGDVMIVDEGFRWQLGIVALEANLTDGKKSGFVLSAVIVEHFDNSIFDYVAGEKEHVEETKAITEDLVSFPDHVVYVGATKDLQLLCQKLVAHFDATHLDSARKTRQALLKRFNERKASK